MTDTIIVFAKTPKAGLVKTRLCPAFSPEEAAEFYASLLADVLETTAVAARRLQLDAVVAVHPAAGTEEMVQRCPVNFRVIAQCGADLAERMEWAVAEAAAAGARRILLRGSDSPVLGEADIAETLEALGDHDLVVSPDLDGGYNLLGLRQPIPGLFDHPMSTSNVLEDTLANARHVGSRVRTREAGFDLDTVDDLHLLARAREQGRTGPCPRVLAYLDERDLWSRSAAS